jgi:hypothetical protein
MSDRAILFLLLCTANSLPTQAMCLSFDLLIYMSLTADQDPARSQVDYHQVDQLGVYQFLKHSRVDHYEETHYRYEAKCLPSTPP